MTFGHFRQTGSVISIGVLAVCAMIAVRAAHAQPQAQTGSPVVQGHVRDASGGVVADAAVFLQPVSTSSVLETHTTHTDSEGTFYFAAVRAGDYTLRAEKNGSSVIVSLANLKGGETKLVELVLLRAASTQPVSAEPVSAEARGDRSSAAHDASESAKPPEFFDEPQFTVAGVTQATNSGGHGSDTVLRNSEALVKATVSLGQGGEDKESAARESEARDSAEKNNLQRERASLQARLVPDKPEGKTGDEATRVGQSDLHHQLALIEEKLGNSLEAVHEYQRAAEVTPSEPNLFDWASELLMHRALEPATEVFAKGTQLYPRSVRMLIGLGVSWYARGSYDRAAQELARASDLAPANPTPYLFMGKMQGVEAVPSEETLERLARFQRLQPGDARANYYYAVGLWKRSQSAGKVDEATSANVEALLKGAIQLDPKLGAAQLQLGILYAERGGFEHAIAAYLRAIEASPELEETHYRLAQAYQRTGEEAKAKEQLEIHEKMSKQSKEEAERERGEIQQFVISLRDGKGESR